jgi:hypothetical protein
MATVKIEGDVEILAIMEMLDIEQLPEACRFKESETISIECAIDQISIDDHASEIEPEPIEPDVKDLREGLEALRAGDLAMARILLDRAFDGHTSETRQAIATALQPVQARRAA